MATTYCATGFIFGKKNFIFAANEKKVLYLLRKYIETNGAPQKMHIIFFALLYAFRDDCLEQNLAGLSLSITVYIATEVAYISLFCFG